MSTDITVTLPDSLCERAQAWAEHSGRTLPDFLAETIELSLLPLGAPPPVETWTDDEVLRVSQDFFSPDDDRRLSELLRLQRDSALDAAGRAELARLMQDYQERLVRKAAALREAVQRGLREPLGS